MHDHVEGADAIAGDQQQVPMVFEDLADLAATETLAERQVDAENRCVHAADHVDSAQAREARDGAVQVFLRTPKTKFSSGVLLLRVSTKSSTSTRVL